MRSQIDLEGKIMKYMFEIKGVIRCCSECPCVDYLEPVDGYPDYTCQLSDENVLGYSIPENCLLKEVQDE